MSVFDQPFMKKRSCSGCDTNMDASNYGFIIKQDSHRGFVKGEDKQRKQELDTLLSEAFNTLTFEEREEQQEALHGVDKEISEEANLIENALLGLDTHLLHMKSGSGYETAEQMDPKCVQDRAFRIMFLRADQYDTRAAAARMLKFFEWKQRLFGVEKLTKEITVDDLDEDDIASLKTGWMQLAGTDRSGRTVFLQLLGLRAFKTLENELRSKYFLLMNLLKSQEVQLRGVIDMTYAVDNYRDSVDGAGFFEHVDSNNALPMRVASVHYCCNDLPDYFICNLAVRAMPAKLRARFRAHFGSHLECQYLLSTFGIVGENLPLMPGTNTISMKHHIKWCKNHLKEPKVDVMMPKHDASSVELTRTAVVFETHPNDVLFMGGLRSHNGGNHQLRNLVMEWTQMYDNSTKESKRFVVDEIIHQITLTGGRFLNQADEGQSFWVPLPMEEVRLKITQAFRNNRRRIRGTRRKRK